MIYASDYLGGSRHIKERFLFLESTVWTVPVTGEYRITAIGAGGEGGRASGDTTSLSSGGSTIIQTPKGTVTLSGGGPGKSGSDAYIDNGGDVTSTVPDIFGRKGGHGGYGGAFAGLGLEIIPYVFGTSASPLLTRGSGMSGTQTGANQRGLGLGGGGGGSTNLNQGGSGGGGGGIVENQPISLTVGDTVTITIGASTQPNSAYSGLVIFDRY